MLNTDLNFGLTDILNLLSVDFTWIGPHTSILCTLDSEPNNTLMFTLKNAFFTEKIHFDSSHFSTTHR